MTPASPQAHSSQRRRRPGALLAAAGLVLLSLPVTVLPAAALTEMSR